MPLSTIYQKANARFAALTVTGMLLASGAFAQTAPAATEGPKTAVQLLESLKEQFVNDSTAAIMAGGGLVITALLVLKGVNLIINFFKRG